MSGMDTTETGNEISQQKIEFTSLLLTEVLHVAGECDRVSDLDPVGPRVAAEVGLGHRRPRRVLGFAAPIVVLAKLQIFALS